ncbi:hypothetical protein CHUAL_005166 [Chamberlinius hualienensis]
MSTQDIQVFAFSPETRNPLFPMIDYEVVANPAVRNLEVLEFLVHRITNRPKGPLLVGRAYINPHYDGFYTRMRMLEELESYEYESEEVGEGYFYKDFSTRTVYFVESVISTFCFVKTEKKGERGESEATQFIQYHFLGQWAIGYEIVYKNFNGAEYKPRSAILDLMYAHSR